MIGAARSFVIVGDAVNKHTVKEWVSVPAAEHMLRIPSFDELATSTVSILGTACARILRRIRVRIKAIAIAQDVGI